MRKPWVFGLVLSLMVVGLSCSGPSNDPVVEDSLTLDNSEDDSLYAPRLAQFPLWVRALVWKEEGVFRTFGFTTHIGEVRQREIATHVESREGEMLFTVSFNPEENADVLYYFGPDSLVSAIEATLFIKTPERRDSLFAQLSAYYDDRLGKPLVESQQEIQWRYLDEYTLSARCEGNKLVHAIAVQVRPAR